MNVRSIAVTLATILFGFSSAHVSAQSVSLYLDCNYDGGGANFPESGKYDMHQLESVGLSNDNISSMIVDEGFAIVFYEGAGFTGVERIIWGPAKVPCLTSEGADNKISSFIIEDER